MIWHDMTDGQPPICHLDGVPWADGDRTKHIEADWLLPIGNQPFHIQDQLLAILCCTAIPHHSWAWVVIWSHLHKWKQFTNLKFKAPLNYVKLYWTILNSFKLKLSHSRETTRSPFNRDYGLPYSYSHPRPGATQGAKDHDAVGDV
jgi:hypothetical protein